MAGHFLSYNCKDKFQLKGSCEHVLDIQDHFWKTDPSVKAEGLSPSTENSVLQLNSRLTIPSPLVMSFTLSELHLQQTDMTTIPRKGTKASSNQYYSCNNSLSIVIAPGNSERAKLQRYSPMASLLLTN